MIKSTTDLLMQNALTEVPHRGFKRHHYGVKGRLCQKASSWRKGVGIKMCHYGERVNNPIQCN